MRARISELMDGELQGPQAQDLLRKLCEDGEARAFWRECHRIGDSMRELQPLSAGFADRVMARIDSEPTVFAPAHRAGNAAIRSIGLRVAASVAAIALVGWLALAPDRGGEAPIPVAQTPKPKPATEPATVPPPAATADYLLAHQRYSPRNALQGMAPYVRTVTAEGGVHRP